jgi:hypothetical protein
MISTALALQEATQEAVHDEMVMAMASELYQNRDTDSESFAKMLYRYSALLASMTTTLVVNAVLTESDLHDLLKTIQEMESMGKDIENGND